MRCDRKDNIKKLWVFISIVVPSKTRTLSRLIFAEINFRETDICMSYFSQDSPFFGVIIIIIIIFIIIIIIIINLFNVGNKTIIIYNR